jgi:hypothetical protein
LTGLERIDVAPSACAYVMKADTVTGTANKEVQCVGNGSLAAVIRTNEDRYFAI